MAVGCMVAALAFADARSLTAAAIVIACAAGTWRGTAAAAVDHGPGAVAGHIGAGQLVLRGTVGDAGVPGRDDVVVVDVHQLASSSGSWDVDGAVAVIPLRAVSSLPGDTVDVQANGLRAPPARPGALSATSVDRLGVTAVAVGATVTILSRGGPTPARLASQLRRLLSDAVARVIPEPAATLMLGIAFGIHARLTPDVRGPLQDSGLIHIVAVSGLKVVIVAGLVMSLARARGWPRRRRGLVTMSVLVLYIALSGAGAAALRSGVMAGAGLVLARDGRRPHSFALLALCAAAMLAVQPALATDVGFQLSFLGTAGILALGTPIAAWLPGPRILAEPCAVTVAAQLATAPVTAGTFGVLSLVGPFANALALPLLPIAIIAGGAGAIAGALVPALGWAPLQVAALVAQLIMAIARGAAAVPFGVLRIQLWPWAWTLVELVAAAAGAVAWVVGRRRGQARGHRIGAVLVAAAAGAVTATSVATIGVPTPLQVTVLDVGNGVAVLVRPPGGGVVLVDGGADGAALLTALGRLLSPLEKHLDAVALTGTDRATAAAVPALVGHYDVGTLVISQPLPAALQAAAAAMAGAGTRVVLAGTAAWTVGGVSVRCVRSAPEDAAACAARITDGHAAVLVTGPLTAVAQDELAGAGQGAMSAQLLVAPTAAAPTPALLRAVSPSAIAVPARRLPAGLAADDQVALTGRDGDLTYEALLDPAGWSPLQ
jgi:competence protein ComEC